MFQFLVIASQPYTLVPNTPNTPEPQRYGITQAPTASNTPTWVWGFDPQRWVERNWIFQFLVITAAPVLHRTGVYGHVWFGV